jgi:hypothetical protein
MKRAAILSLYLLSAALGSGCREQYFEGFVKIGEHIFVSKEHRTQDAVQPDGVKTQLINLKYIESLGTEETSGIYEIEFYCSTGAFRIMGGATYSEPALAGTRTIVGQERPESIRQPVAGLAPDVVIAYARSSPAICKQA